MSYLYKKAILNEFKQIDSFIKVVIKDNIVLCDNDIIQLDIENKKGNIDNLYFYV